MRHTHHGGFHRHFHHPEAQADRRHGVGHHHHHHHRRGPRAFDYGELRVLVLSMIAEEPRHGYELIKSIEERMGGSYSPSPGVMYPTLSWLEDSGYVAVEAAEGNRKRYRITAEGEAFLTANRVTLDDLAARVGADEARGPRGVPAPVLRGMENLKVALRLRMRSGPITEEVAQRIAGALDAAARAVEQL